MVQLDQHIIKDRIIFVLFGIHSIVDVMRQLKLDTSLMPNKFDQTLSVLISKYVKLS